VSAFVLILLQAFSLFAVPLLLVGVIRKDQGHGCRCESVRRFCSRSMTLQSGCESPETISENASWVFIWLASGSSDRISRGYSDAVGGTLLPFGWSQAPTFWLVLYLLALTAS